MAIDPALSRHWGPRLGPDGVEFWLWAPDADGVELLLRAPGSLSGEEIGRAMESIGDGWWRLEAKGAGAGWRYGFRLPGGLLVPDPASRYQPDDCHETSMVVDPGSYRWRHPEWLGRPWHEAVLYELHIGTFTPEGSFRAAADRLDLLLDLGVTAIELMPLADFPGQRNWGYDGVLPFAPDSSYGTPEDLKALVDAAHQRGLMVLLDVVYNHFGPDGNYLPSYASAFFTDRHRTPWGDAINFDSGPERRWVRQFFVDNACYWLDEYRFDGLRLDAVHAIRDDSDEHVLEKLARAVQAGPGAHRHVHLVLENDANESRWLRGPSASRYRAQWNDDFHHAMHVTVSGETDSYYGDFTPRPVAHLTRTLAEGFAYQGEYSVHQDKARGEPSTDLPPTAFVNFIQNHDQIGNRALGERLHELASDPAVRAATEILLLAPMPPLLFMGQEWCASSRFPFFCDFAGELAQAVTQGRLREFSRFESFSNPKARARIPDPGAAETFAAAKLDWSEREQREHQAWWRLHRDLLALRRRHLTPWLEGLERGSSEAHTIGDSGLGVSWRLRDGARYHLVANLGDVVLPVSASPPGTCIYRGRSEPAGPIRLPPWSTEFYLESP